MTAEDLARWDISMIDQKVLKPASYAKMQKDVLPESGAGTQYGLGVGVSIVNGHRLISHGGEVSGFTARNAVYPDDRAAVVVLTNLDATRASQDMANKIAEILFIPPGSEGPLGDAKAIFTGLQQGKIDRSRFTSNANAYFSDQALKDLVTSLAPLGKPTEFSEVAARVAGRYGLPQIPGSVCQESSNCFHLFVPDGKLEQYIVAAD